VEKPKKSKEHLGLLPRSSPTNAIDHNVVVTDGGEEVSSAKQAQSNLKMEVEIQ